MTHDRMNDLLAVTEAVFQQEHQKLRPLLQQEAQIQQQLAQLDTQLVEMNSENAQSDGYRVTGADLLWRGWESTMRRALNLELARLRSQKIAAMDSLRVAFGRKQAVIDLSRRLSDQKRQKNAGWV